MPKQIVRRQFSDNHSLPDTIHPVMRRIYCARNITTPDELDLSLGALYDYKPLLGIEPAVSLLFDAIKLQKRILIVADYDADGATGCALAIRGLRAMGADDIHYIVPSRFESGYGLAPGIVEEGAILNPDLLITVDNGISSIEGVRLARDIGIDVLVTDHHLPGNRMPDANVIVNPNQPGDEFPSKCLAGVGVIFYVLAALRAYLRNIDWFNASGIQEPNLASLLDLVALGTVADVVPMDFNNRILVAQGLSRIRSGQCNPGINALLSIAGKNNPGVKASDLGFLLGPRLNAAGRLEDMSMGIECLLCDDDAQAVKLASRLDELNRERKAIQQNMQDLADMEMISLDNNGTLPYGLCLYDKDWHQGVIGVLASKVKDKWNRPVIAFADDKDGLIKGSARSVKKVHIRDLIDSIATREPGLIKNYGGHAMAAGLTIMCENFNRFSSMFDNEVKQHMGTGDLEGAIITDGGLNPGEINMGLAEEINHGGPWGQEFPEPSFDGIFEIMERRIVGERHLKMLVKPAGDKDIYDAIAFYNTDEEWPAGVNNVQLVYRLDINEYRGVRKLQLIAEYVEPLVSEE